MTTNPFSTVVLGATGSVGNQVVKYLLQSGGVNQITTLGRRPVPNISDSSLTQHLIDVFDSDTYKDKLTHQQIAICTFGVGQPSKVSKDDFIKIDKTAVIAFAQACKAAGVQHFQLLSSVGINANSFSFYLRVKGELVNALEAMNFERLSIFQPSMIITPSNRYGFAQALTLKIWPLIDTLLIGPLKQYRGIKVEHLGKAFVSNIFKDRKGLEMLSWEAITKLSNSQSFFAQIKNDSTG